MAATALDRLRVRWPLRRRSRERGPMAPATGGGRPATFRDRALEAQLERDGFVVVDLLDASALERLQAGYQALDHEHHRSSPFAAGFNTTMYDARTEHRRRVLELLEETIGRAIASVLDDHRLYVGNFAVKLPHSESVPFHLDWSFVDEATCRSVGIWCAVFDTDEANGTLGMVRSSHRSTRRIRAVNDRAYEGYEDHAATIPDRRILPLRAGQAIVYDSRTVHFSPPNDTDRERVAAACGAAPAGQPLHHYWFDDENRLQRFEVTPDFYLSYEVGGRPADADGVLGRTELRSDLIEPG